MQGRAAMKRLFGGEPIPAEVLCHRNTSTRKTQSEQFLQRTARPFQRVHA